MWVMNSATETASGIAMITASTAASAVPNASGAMYEIRLLPSGSSDELALIAGTDSAIRKIATPASRARIVTPAITATLEKIRSPGRRLPPEADARICPALVVVSRCASKVM